MKQLDIMFHGQLKLAMEIFQERITESSFISSSQAS